ncbi:MAG: fatty acid desaturase [Candidatus Omnitrophica bacterium]|nr:fatty acid desaturase [Candidatus Omnitrophota bacterium]
MTAIRKNIWVNIVFFAVTTGFAVIGCPWYAFKMGLTPLEIGLTLFYMAATGLGITAGYHRLFAHATYKAHPLVKLWFLFFGAAAFEQSALMWSSQHRDHHRYVDTDKDPYSIKKGFFYAHMGWLVFWEHPMHYENAKDLQKDFWVQHQHRHYLAWSVVSGIVAPVFIGALFGHALGAFLFAVCLRLTVVYHSTFCINSVCHVFGKSTYDANSTAKDHWLVALITYGEGYHNFHHHFPVDYRNGIRWFDWDPSKWLIRTLAFLGLAQGLKRTSPFRIMEARLAGDKVRAAQALAVLGTSGGIERAVDQLTQYHHALRQMLAEWEDAVRNYHEIFRGQAALQSQELKILALSKIREAQTSFKHAREKWNESMQFAPAQLREFLLGAKFESVLAAG